MTTKFQSNALWPEGVCSSMYGDNISTDTHSSIEAARGVCNGLRREGFGGERKHFPLLTWISEPQQPPVVPATLGATPSPLVGAGQPTGEVHGGS